MRLLSVFTGKLEEYFGSDIPEYAILSHTWARDEVTFSDIQKIRDGAQATDTDSSREEALSDPAIASPTPLKDTPPKTDEAREPPRPPKWLVFKKERTEWEELGMYLTPS
jgi:hypothetical protein